MDNSVPSHADNGIVSQIGNGVRQISCVAWPLSCNDKARSAVPFGRILPVVDVCISCCEERTDMVEIDV